MSCTVIAIPYALAWVIGAVATAAGAEFQKSIDRYRENNYNNFQEKDYGCEDVQTITADHFIEKTFETPFVDKEILEKTLTEHCGKNVNVGDLEAFAVVEGYNLTFTRTETDKPYLVRITSKEQNNAAEKLEDLNSEYAMNVQEDAYLHIIDKLKENNMQIEDEVVEDDNTIVLTVNID